MQGKPSTIVKQYHVSKRTAEAVRRLSFETHETEGRVIDKLVRSYMTELCGGDVMRCNHKCETCSHKCYKAYHTNSVEQIKNSKPDNK